MYDPLANARKTLTVRRPEWYKPVSDLLEKDIAQGAS
jgi:hypothetical protein